ncbi:hypothetical protein [Epilithonimonas sp. UC225_85]|uniref:hypothetical protein n=1 Tax=Epilithonimonas sp. UC225_85 TaxID=3350167 RepID=UPI0036D41219
MKKIYYLIFSIYLVISIYFLKKEISLEYEWIFIMKDFAKYGWEYRLYGMYSAYMPPFYSYFLLISSKVFGSNWLTVVCCIQGLTVFFSLFSFFKVLFEEKRFSVVIVLAFCSILFFPPILIGVYKISSFAFSLSVMLLFFTILYKISKSKIVYNKQWGILAILSIVGLYLRYEFIFIISLSIFAFYINKRISVKKMILLGAMALMAYFPWCLRNYYMIGKFAYSTSYNFNFAKGYNEKYDPYITFNNPYSPQLKKIVTNKMLSEMFTNEKDMDEYLGNLNHDFIMNNPKLFIKLTATKFLINFTQYFPGYEGINRYKIYIFYSWYMMAVQVLLILSLRKIYLTNKRSFLLYMTGGLYLFFLFFYIIAPLPRYILLFYPIFIAVILKTYYRKNINSINK